MLLRTWLLGFLCICALAAPTLACQKPVKPTAPAFEIRTLDGDTLSSEQLYGHKPVLISLWATWCGPCRQEAPVLNKLYAEYGTKVQFLAISVDDPNAGSAVRDFQKSQGINYPIAHDTKAIYGQRFQADAIPKVVMVDKHGTVVHESVGFGGEAELTKAFKEAYGL
ncbi:MAG: TlpA disulfide reductase family protein [bacterium]